ncbi:hypothetical protein DFH94DRAFT_777536 [Russula ochroleuca]|uniref:Uncharacterized protein n=1 Tax=Russula ochroleuca TaxID=152965 RepID=A0A9P5JWU6_9AGAM|nr:hypothetical protein DFH94DRAFT_777536 [Russula ochroleuca]
MVREPDLQLYHSRMREAGLRDRPPPEGLSLRERLAALHRWESAWDGDQNDNDNDNDEDEGVEIEVGVGDNPGIFAAGDSTTQRVASVVEIEESDPDSRVLVVEDFYVEMHALADSRADFCGYRYLDLRSLPLRREDVLTVRHDFDQKVGLLSYAFAIEKYKIFAVLIEAPWLCDNAALQLLNFHDGKPHQLTPRPITITDRIFCMAEMHNMEDQILIVMTVDIPGRPESRITLVGLNDLCITPVRTMCPLPPANLSPRNNISFP